MRLRSSALRHSSSVLSAMRAPPPPPPTLLTRISIPPKAAVAASTSRAAWSGCPTSARQDATATPSARKGASVAASGAAERAASTRQQPSAAKALAVARPIPRLEPVIRATLSFSFRSIARLHSACPGRDSIKGGWAKNPILYPYKYLPVRHFWAKRNATRTDSPPHGHHAAIGAWNTTSIGGTS